MSTVVTVAGINYTIPAFNDAPSTGWGVSLSNFFIAVAAQIASTPAFMQTVVVTVSPQAVVSGKTYLVNTAVPITLNLPSPVVNTWFIVKDSTQQAGTNNITIHRFGTEKIDGTAADMVINTSNDGFIFVSDGTNWFTIASAAEVVLTDTVTGKTYQLMMTNGRLGTLEIT